MTSPRATSPSVTSPMKEQDAGTARILCLLLRFAPVMAVLTAIPCAIALLTGDEATAATLAPGLIVALIGCWLTRGHPPPEDATEREDAVAVALVFPLALLLSSAPYLAHDLSVLDAAFEGMSGVTATGLSRYGATPEGIGGQPYGVLFLRAWQEFVGGYAIVTLTVALLPRGSEGAQKMAESDVADDAGQDGKHEEPDLKRRSALVTGVYALLALACIALTWLAGSPFPVAVLHGLAAASTGGFGAYDDSLASVAGGQVAVLMVFSVLAAVALSDYVRPVTERAGLGKLAWTLGAIVLLSLAAAGAVAWIEPGGFGGGPGGPGGLGDRGGFAFADILQVAFSAQTTTGFSALAVGELSDASKGVLIASMFVGGDLGSTAGGLKIVRFAALAFALYAFFRPRADRPGVPGDGARGALRLIAWWFGLTAAGWLMLVTAGHPGLDALFEWSSALNNTGLSVGVSDAETPVLTRLALILAMWMGRVEILAVVLLIRPAFDAVRPNDGGGREGA